MFRDFFVSAGSDKATFIRLLCQRCQAFHRGLQEVHGKAAQGKRRISRNSPAAFLEKQKCSQEGEEGWSCQQLDRDDSSTFLTEQRWAKALALIIIILTFPLPFRTASFRLVSCGVQARELRQDRKAGVHGNWYRLCSYSYDGSQGLTHDCILVALQLAGCMCVGQHARLRLNRRLIEHWMNIVQAMVWHW